MTFIFILINSAPAGFNFVSSNYFNQETNFINVLHVYKKNTTTVHTINFVYLVINLEHVCIKCGTTSTLCSFNLDVSITTDGHQWDSRDSAGGTALDQ